jgi:hypothetical protein
MSGEPSCPICDGAGTYPIISARGVHLYDITCPKCLGISDEEIERRNAEDRKALDEWRVRNL